MHTHAHRRARPRRKRRRAGWAWGAVALATAVLAAQPSLLTDRLPGGGESERLPAPPPPVDPDRPTRDDPFAGSPAREWSDGAEGIDTPAAEPVGSIGEERMAEALDQARTFLIETNLDHRVLAGELPESALAMLDPASGVDAYVDRALSEPSREHDAATLFSRFHPEDAGVLGDVVKVRGRTEVSAGDEDDGGARIRLDYTFVYPLVAADGSGEITRSVVRRDLEFLVLDPEQWEITPGTLWLNRWNADRANDDCSVTDGFLNPLFDSDLLGSPQPPSGPATDPYDRGGDVAEDPDECGTVSRI